MICVPVEVTGPSGIRTQEHLICGGHLVEAFYEAISEEPDNAQLVATLRAGLNITRLDPRTT